MTAYQELLREQQGSAVAVQRVEVINKFLDETENYLNKLAMKVAAVKHSQQAIEAAAAAAADARSQVRSSQNSHKLPALSVVQ